MVPILSTLVAFIISWIIGGIAIYVGASLVVDATGIGRALGTALLGAIAWALTAWIPLVGTALALVVWIGVIRWRYPGGWKQAAAIGIVAWAAAMVVLAVVDAVTHLGIGAFGVPGI